MMVRFDAVRPASLRPRASFTTPISSDFFSSRTELVRCLDAARYSKHSTAHFQVDQIYLSSLFLSSSSSSCYFLVPGERYEKCVMIKPNLSGVFWDIKSPAQPRAMRSFCNKYVNETKKKKTDAGPLIWKDFFFRWLIIRMKVVLMTGFIVTCDTIPCPYRCRTFFFISMRLRSEIVKRPMSGAKGDRDRITKNYYNFVSVSSRQRMNANDHLRSSGGAATSTANRKSRETEKTNELADAIAKNVKMSIFCARANGHWLHAKCILDEACMVPTSNCQVCGIVGCVYVVVVRWMRTSDRSTPSRMFVHAIDSVMSICRMLNYKNDFRNETIAAHIVRCSSSSGGERRAPAIK